MGAAPHGPGPNRAVRGALGQVLPKTSPDDIVARIEGSYTNVVGLPASEVIVALEGWIDAGFAAAVEGADPTEIASLCDALEDPGHGEYAAAPR